MSDTIVTYSPVKFEYGSFSSFQNEGQFILQGQDLSSFSVKHSHFDSYTNSSVISAKSVESFLVQNNTFSSVATSLTDETRAILIDSSTASLQDNIFENLRHQENGGAILIKNSVATMLNNTLRNNKAEKGGALEFECDDSVDCSLELNTNTFEGNEADEGGALHYNMIRPSGMTENTYIQNKAQYGADFASFPAFIELPNSQLLIDLASGQMLPYSLIFNLLDYDKQRIENDNSS